VCQPKAKGGLGLRDIKLVNFSLLAKWRWKLINENGYLWWKVLVDKYEERVGGVGGESGESWPSYAFIWWKDVMNLEGSEGVNWFKSEVVRKIGNGMGAYFWKDRWLAGGVLRDLFPRLYAISTQKNIMVAELWIGGGMEWNWEFRWRRNLFVWESEILQNLTVLLEGVEVRVRMSGGDARGKMVCSRLSLAIRC